jgi:hypothetical protein
MYVQCTHQQWLRILNILTEQPENGRKDSQTGHPGQDSQKMTGRAAELETGQWQRISGTGR